MAQSRVHIRYRGNGQYLIGIPAKDMTEEEFNALEPFQQNEVLASDIYNEVQHRNSSADDGKSSSRTAESEKK